MRTLTHTRTNTQSSQDPDYTSLGKEFAAFKKAQEQFQNGFGKVVPYSPDTAAAVGPQVIKHTNTHTHTHTHTHTVSHICTHTRTHA